MPTGRAQVRSGFVVGGLSLLILAFQPAAAHAADAAWQPVGPRGGGSVTSLAVDAGNPAVAYAVADSGLLKTTDGGVSWFHLAAAPGFPAKVATDPITPGTLYAVGGGVAKSVDGGASWTSSYAGLESAPFTVDLAIDPATPSTLYVASGSYVFKSLDAGATWTLSSTGLPGGPPPSPGTTQPITNQVLNLAIDAGRPAVVYAGTEVGVFRSVDGGASWQPARAGMNQRSVFALAADPSAPGRVYASVALRAFTTQTGDMRAFLVSEDGGETWAPRPLSASNPLVLCLAVPPAAHGTVYACADNQGLFKSGDGGSHWAPIDAGLGASYFLALAVAPSQKNHLYAGVGLPTNVGPAIYRTSSAGAAWQPSHNDVGALGLSSVAVDPSQAGSLYVGTADGVLKSRDDGRSWTPASGGLPSRNIVIRSLTISPSNPSVLYAVTNSGLHVRNLFSTQDAGGNWRPPSSVFQAASGLVVGPGSPLTVFASGLLAGTPGMFRSLDGGATWSAIDTPAQGQLAPSPSDPSRLYLVAWKGNPAPFETELFASDDGGASFQAVSTFQSPFFPQVLVVDPRDANTLYYSPGPDDLLYKSTDGGATALPISPTSFDLTTLIVDPTNTSVLYGCRNSNEVVVSRDGGATWNALAPGLPANQQVTQLALGPSGTLYALIANHGLYRVDP